MKKFLTKSDIQVALRAKKKSLIISENSSVTMEAEDFAKFCGIKIIREKFSRKKYFLGNWKMNNSLNETAQYFNNFSISDFGDNYVGVALPATHIFIGNYFKNLQIGAQNFYPAKKGAYTGETSIEFLKELNVSFVLIGHSERRHVLNESQKFIDSKIDYAIKNYSGKIVYCIGETFEEKNSGKTLSVLRTQLEYIKNNEIDTNNIILAYEPVWAIGTGLVSENNDIERIMEFIRNLLNKNIHNTNLGNNISILYGGSVNNNNIKKLCDVESCDGFLIGGASLKPCVFSEMYFKFSGISND